MIQQTIAKKMLLAIMPVIVVFVLGIILLSGSYHKEINQANKNKITTILDLISPLVELQLSLGNLDEIQKIIRTPSQLDGIISITVSDVDNQFITSINTKAAEKKNQNIKEHRRDIVQLFGANESGRLKIGEIVILEDTTWGTRKLTQIQEIAIPSLMIGFLALWLLIRAFNREITQPAKRIEKAINNIASGDIDFEFIPTSNNELRSLEDMVIKLLESLRRNREMQREMQEMRVETQTALEAKRVRTEFLAHISHEIKSPLNTICGYLDILTEVEANTPLDPRNALRIKSMQKTATHLRTLVNDMLDFTSLESKRKTLDIAESNLWDKIEATCLLHHEIALANNSTINIIIDKSVPEFGLTAETPVTKSLSNLVSNAAKFTHDGEINVWARMSEGYMLIDVQDTGIGIPKSQIKVIFDAFVQADNSTTKKYEGTGLGLAIAKMEAERIGGELTCSFSEPGQGSTFRLSFPVGSVRASKPSYPAFSANVAILAKSENQYQSIRGAFARAGASFTADKSDCDIMVCDASREDEARASGNHRALIVLIDQGSRTESEDLPLTQRMSIITTEDARQILGADSHRARERRSDEVQRIQQQNVRVIAVDDEETSLDILCWNLNKIGIMNIRRASNAPQALQHARTQDFDILITDLHMPGMDGFELIARIKEFKPAARIYVISADSQKKNIERLKDQLGVAHVIGKPYTSDELRRLIYRQEDNGDMPDPESGLEGIRKRYYAGLSASLDRLENAISMKDEEKMREILHALTGNAAMVEDQASVDALQDLRPSILAGEFAQARDLLAWLRRTHPALQDRQTEQASSVHQ